MLALQIIKELPRSFGSALVLLMEKKEYTNESLAETISVSSKTIQRMRNDSKQEYEINTVIAICVGLQLFPQISREMLEMAGITLKNTERDFVYSMIIDTFYKRPIGDCNELLISAKQPPLTACTESA
jgi:DNA-binding Xre family transcriptional regulator